MVSAKSIMGRRLNPLRLLSVRTNFSYEQLPTYDTSNAPSPFSTTSLRKIRWPSPSRMSEKRLRLPKVSMSRMLTFALTSMLCVSLLGVALYRRRHHGSLLGKGGSFGPAYDWEHFTRLNGFYNGIRTLTSYQEWTPEQSGFKAPPRLHKPQSLPIDPIIYHPYPDYGSYEYLRGHHPVEECFLDEDDSVPAPDIFAYPGIPQNMTAPYFGSYDVLDIRGDVCFDRFGRYASYGYGYSESLGGLELANDSEDSGVERIWQLANTTDYRGVNWGSAQQRCLEKNKKRFETDAAVGGAGKHASPKARVPRHVFILRAWTGFDYTPYQTLSLRAMINELALKSGAEYDIHLLVHVKNESIPIWASEDVYQETIEQFVPDEFRGLVTLWSEAMLKPYYPDPFPDNIENPADSDIHGVYRSAHFALQWFSQQHPEYDFYWNWEVDMRYTGHYYEFHSKISEWAKQQPRKGLWERSGQYFIPDYHKTWWNFSSGVEAARQASGEEPVWGPVTFPTDGTIPSPVGTTPPTTFDEDGSEWGVGEDADLIVFNPIFDPNKTNWYFKDDITGFSRKLPVPPRRAAIITAGRYSKRLLDVMHKETYMLKHTAFPEMWPATAAVHHGLKAVYAPHPIYFDRAWPLDYIEQVFNRPETPDDSVFGGGEHNHQGSSFYYNSGFSGALWRRWLGAAENDEGGAKEERAGSGRMCLRSMLFHPIKKESGS